MTSFPVLPTGALPWTLLGDHRPRDPLARPHHVNPFIIKSWVRLYLVQHYTHTDHQENNHKPEWRRISRAAMFNGSTISAKLTRAGSKRNLEQYCKQSCQCVAKNKGPSAPRRQTQSNPGSQLKMAGRIKQAKSDFRAALSCSGELLKWQQYIYPDTFKALQAKQQECY